jgi:hypothetical protein
MRLPTLRRPFSRAERIAQLALPDPFDLFVWRDNLVVRRRRPIELWPCSSDELITLTGDSGVHAVLLAVRGCDIVCYKADIPRFMVEHNLIHEFCHLACDHRVPLVVTLDMGRLEQICLTRTSTASERRDLERVTEDLTLWVERYRGDGALPLAVPDAPLPSFYDRIVAVLGERVRP